MFSIFNFFRLVSERNNESVTVDTRRNIIAKDIKINLFTETIRVKLWQFLVPLSKYYLFYIWYRKKVYLIRCMCTCVCVWCIIWYMPFRRTSPHHHHQLWAKTPPIWWGASTANSLIRNTRRLLATLSPSSAQYLLVRILAGARSLISAEAGITTVSYHPPHYWTRSKWRNLPPNTKTCIVSRLTLWE